MSQNLLQNNENWNPLGGDMCYRACRNEVHRWLLIDPLKDVKVGIAFLLHFDSGAWPGELLHA